jgi:NAD dependent epimerase/dehydratase
LATISKNATVFVTGAEGFIGSHLCEALVHKGYKVKALVQYNSFNNWGWLEDLSDDIQSSIRIVSGDIRDPHGINQAIRGSDAIIHLAALIAIPYSYSSPASYVETNVNGTLNILQAARQNDVSRVIHTSTSEVYGTARYVPIDENHPLQGQSPYSASKIAADQIAYSFFSSFDLPVVTVRPFNTYGPRQSARAVIPTIITQILSGKKDLELGSTQTTRDFTFITDTVSGFIAALECTQGAGEVFNLGTNFEISIEEINTMIHKILEVPISLKMNSSRLRPEKSEVLRLWSDNSKAMQTLNWIPKYVGLQGLEAGLRETIDWFKNESNLSKYKSGIYNL